MTSSALASFVNDSKVYFYRVRDDDFLSGHEPEQVIASISRRASVPPESIQIDHNNALQAGSVVTIINNKFVVSR